MDWPWPEDTKEARHRRIIDSYRHALSKVDPAGCKALDEQLAEYGQKWVAGRELIGNDELRSAKDFAELFDLNPWTVPAWSRDHPERIPRHKRGGQTLFRVGDVRAWHVL